MNVKLGTPQEDLTSSFVTGIELGFLPFHGLFLLREDVEPQRIGRVRIPWVDASSTATNFSLSRAVDEELQKNGRNI